MAEAFKNRWDALVLETSRPDWRFAAVANLHNFSYDGDMVDLGHGVSIQGRRFDRLKEALNWDDYDCERLTQDWMTGGGPSSYVLVVVTSEPKRPENFILSSDGLAYPLTARVLLAMRLHGAGDVNIGRMFLNRPAAFNVGVGGGGAAGMTVWRAGTPYNLTSALIPKFASKSKRW